MNKFLRLPRLSFSTVSNEFGFTLIELLVALTILSILAVGVYAALNPAQRLSDAKDAKRASDVDAILTALHEFSVDKKGIFPTNMPAVDTETQLGTAGSGCAINNAPHCNFATAACADLMSGANNLSAYLKSMPYDPDTAFGSDAETGYSVTRDSNGLVIVKACYTSGTLTISAAR